MFLDRKKFIDLFAGIGGFRIAMEKFGGECVFSSEIDKYAQTTYNENHDFTFNAFNVDMVFRWIFAPASELIFVWKNNIFAEKSEIINDYFDDLRYTFNSPMGNSFSLKVLYYLDYQSLKKKNRKK